MKNTLNAVIQTLCGLFENKCELRGLSDWDTFIGCIMELQKISNNMPEDEVVDNG